MSQIELTIQDVAASSDQIARALAKALDPINLNLRDFFWVDCTNILSENFLEIFTVRSADSHGTPWPPHADKTIDTYGPHPLLILSSTLLQSLVDGNPFSVAIQNNNEFEYGTSLVYAAIQNFGGDTGKARIPAREYLYLTEEAESAILDALQDRVIESIQKELEGAKYQLR